MTFLFFLYVGVQIPLIPNLIEDGLGGSEFDIGLNLAAFSIAAIAIRPFIGTWGDRYGRRVLMIVGSLVPAIAVALMVLVDNRWLLLPLRGLAGIGEGAVFVGAATLISDLAPAHRRAEASSYFSVACSRRPRHRADPRRGADRQRLLRHAVCSPRRGAVRRRLLRLRGPGTTSHPSLEDAEPDDAVDEPNHLLPSRRAPPGRRARARHGGFATFNAFMPDHADDVGLDGSKWVFALYSVVCLVVRIAGATTPGADRPGPLRRRRARLPRRSDSSTLAAIADAVRRVRGNLLIALGMAFITRR